MPVTEVTLMILEILIFYCKYYSNKNLIYLESVIKDLNQLFKRNLIITEWT